MAGLFSALGATGVGKWLSSQLKNLNLGSLLPWFGSLGAGAAAHARNTHLMRQQNAFNAGEAALNRDFQHNEAEIARQWQEDFYNQYQSPQAMVHQYEAAGLNPVLSTGLPTNTPPSASIAQGSMAQGASAPYLDATGIMQQFMGLMKLDAEIANIKADTSNKTAQAGAANAEAAYKTNLNNLTNAQVNLVTEQFRKVAAEAKNEEYKANILSIEKEIKELQRNQDLREQTFHDKFGFYPNDSLQAVIVKLADKRGSEFKKWLINTMTDLNNSLTLQDYTKQ